MASGPSETQLQPQTETQVANSPVVFTGVLPLEQGLGPCKHRERKPQISSTTEHPPAQ